MEEPIRVGLVVAKKSLGLLPLSRILVKVNRSKARLGVARKLRVGGIRVKSKVS
jgi:hypothetical protein